jgi:hypothetical protein
MHRGSFSVSTSSPPVISGPAGSCRTRAQAIMVFGIFFIGSPFARKPEDKQVEVWTGDSVCMRHGVIVTLRLQIPCELRPSNAGNFGYFSQRNKGKDRGTLWHAMVDSATMIPVSATCPRRTQWRQASHTARQSILSCSQARHTQHGARHLCLLTCNTRCNASVRCDWAGRANASNSTSGMTRW